MNADQDICRPAGWRLIAAIAIHTLGSDAVRAGAAEWVADEHGRAVWRWKPDLRQPRPP